MGFNDWKVVKFLQAGIEGDVGLTNKYSVSGKYSITLIDGDDALFINKKTWGDVDELVFSFWITIEHSEGDAWIAFGPVIQYQETVWPVLRYFYVNVWFNPGNKIRTADVRYYEWDAYSPYPYYGWYGYYYDWYDYYYGWVPYYYYGWYNYYYGGFIYIADITNSLKQIIGEKWDPGYWVMFAFKTDGSYLSLYASEPIEKPNPKKIPPLHNIISNAYVTWNNVLTGHKGLFIGSNIIHFIYLDDYRIYDP